MRKWNVRGILTKAQLALKAIVYVRQSTDEQVRENTGSADYQRSQAEFAKALGYNETQIDLEEDLGLSGSDAASRPAYQRMRAAVRAGSVGAVFVSDQTRLSRDVVEALDFARDAAVHGVALVIDGRVTDLRDRNDRFMQGLTAMFAEHENQMRRDNMEKGRIGKLDKGQAVSLPPVGYVVEPNTRGWLKDPDPAVQQAIRTVFEAFLTVKSMLRTVKELLRLGMQIPRQRAGQPIYWIAPCLHAVQQILTHPAYMGDYVYGRRRSDPRLPKDRRGRLRQRKAAADQMLRIVAHHDPYVSRAEWDEVQVILAANTWRKSKLTPPNTGRSVLQGIIRCAACKVRMRVHYKSKRNPDRGAYDYTCIGATHRGGKACPRVPGRHVDRAVRAAVLGRLAAPGTQALRNAYERKQACGGAAVSAAQAALSAQRRKVADLERRLAATDPGLTHVYGSIARRLNDATQAVLQGERALERTSKTDFTAEHLNALIALAVSAETIWDAATTEARDRQELTRLLVRRAYVIARTAELVTVRLVWADGMPDSILRISLSKAARRLIIASAAEGKTPAEIATLLASMGVQTRFDTVWSAHAVRRALHRWGHGVRRKGAQ
jgi:DNA invertase Pin-like site-specific DNA recombinase